MRARMEVCFIHGVVLTTINIRPLALWPDVLHRLCVLSQYLDISLGKRVVRIEEVVNAMAVLEALRVS